MHNPDAYDRRDLSCLFLSRYNNFFHAMITPEDVKFFILLQKL